MSAFGGDQGAAQLADGIVQALQIESVEGCAVAAFVAATIWGIHRQVIKAP